jgi:hypothetical protein
LLALGAATGALAWEADTLAKAGALRREVHVGLPATAAALPRRELEC